MKKKGFTLVELIPVVLILGLVMISVGSVLHYGLDINKRQNIQSSVQSDVSKAMTDLSDNIRRGVHFIKYADAASLDEAFNAIYVDHDSIADVEADYTCIVFIQQVSGKYCLYAKKGSELHRIDFERMSDTITLSSPEDPVKSAIDQYTRQYYFDNYRWDKAQPITNFNFYQGSSYYNCETKTTVGKDYYYVTQLIREPDILTKKSDVILSDKVKDIEIDPVNGADAYHVTATVLLKNNMSGNSYEKSFNFNIALVNYGGDDDEK